VRILAPENNHPKREEIDLLSIYFNSFDPIECERALERLFSEKISPLVNAALRRKMRVSMSPDDLTSRNGDALELSADIRAQLVEVFARFKSNGLENPIQNLDAYIRVITANTFNQFLRDRYPTRLRLKNKILYIFRHRPGLSVWQDDSTTHVCGRAEWSGRASINSIQLESRLQDFEHEQSVASIDDNKKIIEAIEELLQRLDSPVRLNDLTNTVAKWLGLAGPYDRDVCIDEVVEGENEADLVLNRIALQEFWHLLRKLSPEHRKALLLNLRDPAGDNLLAFLPILRIASIREIAAAVEMSPEELAEIWDRLPLDDNAIAERLSLKRQQVINLRQSARAQLRRMRDKIR
jgi:DNA-directed RNA polymerase specialized sigma24 family protein